MKKVPRLTIRVSEDEANKLQDLAKKFKVTPTELARKYLIDGMTNITEDLHLVHLRIRGLEEQLDTNAKFILESLAGELLLYNAIKGIEGEEERKKAGHDFLTAVGNMGPRIPMIKSKN